MPVWGYVIAVAVFVALCGLSFWLNAKTGTTAEPVYEPPPPPPDDPDPDDDTIGTG